MKLIVKRAAFAHAMAAAAAVAPSRSVKPSLTQALLHVTQEGLLEITAADMEVGLRSQIKPESVSAAQDLCLPCSMLAGLLGDCQEDDVTLETDGNKGKLTIGRDEFDIIGMEPDNFPTSPEFGDGPVITVPAADLKGLIDRTVFAAAREQGRYAINGVYLLVKEKGLEIVATDGKRLAYGKLKLKAPGGMEEGVILPVKMVQEVRKLCDEAGAEGEIQLAVRGRQALVRAGTVVLWSALVEGIFPKYQQVIPKDCDRSATFSREGLLQALRKASYMTTKETRCVTLVFSAGQCKIESHSPDVGQASVSMEAEFSGEKMSISFNPSFLSECLATLSEEKIKLEMKDPSRPGVVREGSDYLYVIMPLSTRD